MYETLMPNVMVPEAHQNNRSCVFVSSVDFRFTTQEFSIVGGYMEDLKKKQHKTVKIWGWVLVPWWALAWDNRVIYRFI